MAWETAQSKLVEHLRRQGVAGERVLSVLARIPRDLFVGEEQRPLAFADQSLPIGADQTISQPSVVAAMTEALDVQRTHRVLEVGTGSGYQAAVLAELAGSVVTVERKSALAHDARRLLAYLGYHNVSVVEGDGTRGWPDGAPYDRILVAAAGPAIPQPLLDQLAPGGRLVAPVGGRAEQELLLITRTASGSFEEQPIGPVRFVPLVGAHGWPE